MCFSPEVSFAAAAVIGTIGILTLRKVKYRKQIPLALIPIFFATQQLIEGLIWISDKPGSNSSILAYGFLFFAYVLWPFFVPLAYRLVETHKTRQKILNLLTIVGLAVSTGLLIKLIILSPVVINIHGHLKYQLISDAASKDSLLYLITISAYIFSTCGVGLFTSHKYLRICSAIISFALLTSVLFFLATWPSVWCLFSAIISSVIYLHFKYPTKA